MICHSCFVTSRLGVGLGNKALRQVRGQNNKIAVWEDCVKMGATQAQIIAKNLGPSRRSKEERIPESWTKLPQDKPECNVDMAVVTLCVYNFVVSSTVRHHWRSCNFSLVASVLSLCGLSSFCPCQDWLGSLESRNLEFLSSLSFLGDIMPDLRNQGYR